MVKFPRLGNRENVNVYSRGKAKGREREMMSLFLCETEGPEGALCGDVPWGTGSRKLVL